MHYRKNDVAKSWLGDEKLNSTYQIAFLKNCKQIVSAVAKMTVDPLPNEEQRRALCELMHQAFIDLRYLEGEQAHDLAYAFHNLPVEIYGWGTWNVRATRERLTHYQSKHHENQGFDYVHAFDAIFPQIA